MALNQIEQRIYDYVRKNPDERHYWEHKVRSVAAAHGDDFTSAAALDIELRAYVVERVRVARQLADVPTGTSMRSLAEYLIRMWTDPRPRKKKAEGDFML